MIPDAFIYYGKSIVLLSYDGVRNGLGIDVNK